MSCSLKKKSKVHSKDFVASEKCVCACSLFFYTSSISSCISVQLVVSPSSACLDRCIAEEAMQVIGEAQAPSTRKANNDMHASSAGSGWRGDDWVLHTLTLSSFVVSSLFPCHCCLVSAACLHFSFIALVLLELLQRA